MATTTLQAFIDQLIKASADNQMVSVGLAPGLVTTLAHRLIESGLKLPLTEMTELIQLLEASRTSEAHVTVALAYPLAGDIVDMHQALDSGARQIMDLNDKLDAANADIASRDSLIRDLEGRVAAMEKAGA